MLWTPEAPVGTFDDGLELTGSAPVHTFEDPGVYNASVRVEDDEGLASYANVEVLVTTAGGVVPPSVVSLPEAYAVVGRRYSYNEAGRPTARGDRPLSWVLGSRVGDDIVNSPDGMTLLDPATGAIDWTPGADQVGTHDVTLRVSNAARSARHDWTITVVASDEGPAEENGCGGCGGGTSGRGEPLPALLLLSAAWLLRPRRQETHGAGKSASFFPLTGRAVQRRL